MLERAYDKNRSLHPVLGYGLTVEGMQRVDPEPVLTLGGHRRGGLRRM